MGDDTYTTRHSFDNTYDLNEFFEGYERSKELEDLLEVYGNEDNVIIVDFKNKKKIN